MKIHGGRTRLRQGLLGPQTHQVQPGGRPTVGHDGELVGQAEEEYVLLIPVGLGNTRIGMSARQKTDARES